MRAQPSSKEMLLIDFQLSIIRRRYLSSSLHEIKQVHDTQGMVKSLQNAFHYLNPEGKIIIFED